MITVFTNGVFDLLHGGHCRLLEWARAQGTRLIVGLNSDDSVRRLKGPHRPIIPEHDRAELLLVLKWVDQVIIFNEDTPLELIIFLRPDVLVKGPDYAGKQAVGQEFVESLGGKVMIPNWPTNISTSAIIAKIRDCYDYCGG